ncbi:H-X9-DG-CTERM domain-containing protein [Pseudomonas sp. MF6776]
MGAISDDNFCFCDGHVQ